jgi:hypothetical protein
MAHKKIGLSYYTTDTDWEFKVKVFKAKYKLTGIGFITELWKAAYKDDGYFLKFGNDEKLLFCSENDLAENVFDEMLSFAFVKEIFNKLMYEKYNILTSSGIQKRYIEASRKRSSICLDAKYLLINPETPKWSNLKIEISGIDSSNSSVSGAGAGMTDSVPESGDPAASSPQKKRNENKGKVNTLPSGSGSETFVPEPETDLISELLEIFSGEYELNRQMIFETLNTNKEKKAIGKLLSTYKAKNKSSPKTIEETKNDFRKYFKACLMITDNWYRENMSPGLIVNKFNEIKTILCRKNNNGAGNNNKPGATVEGIVGAIGKAFNIIGSARDNG